MRSAAAPRAGRSWSPSGPHPIGTERHRAMRAVLHRAAHLLDSGAARHGPTDDSPHSVRPPRWLSLLSESELLVSRPPSSVDVAPRRPVGDRPSDTAGHSQDRDLRSPELTVQPTLYLSLPLLLPGLSLPRMAALSPRLSPCLSALPSRWSARPADSGRWLLEGSGPFPGSWELAVREAGGCCSGGWRPTPPPARAQAPQPPCWSRRSRRPGPGRRRGRPQATPP